MRLVNCSLIFSFVLCVVFACSNTKDFTTTVPTEEVKDGTNDGQGQTKMKTITGADPTMDKNESNEVADVSKLNSTATEIEWLDFETAIDRNAKNKKFIFIDIYTNWCTWCKKMDQSTFKNPDVIKYMDHYFYCVKINAESSEAIAYKEVLYELKNYGTKKYNELAVNLMSGKISFPSFIVLNKREVKRGVINGFQTPSQLLSTLNTYTK